MKSTTYMPYGKALVILKGKTITLIIVAFFVLSGCQAPLYRTTMASIKHVQNECKMGNKEKEREEQAECRIMTPEASDSYELHFVEFDDQGWIPSGPKVGDLDPQPDSCKKLSGMPYTSETTAPNEAYYLEERPDCQLEFLMARLTNLAKEDGNAPIRIVLYVHGWKHNAAYDDENVKGFRETLKYIKDEAKNPDTRVVGIYIGWRGLAFTYLKTDIYRWINYFTFYDRQLIAQQVAKGSINELLIWLEGYRKTQNASNDKTDKHEEGEEHNHNRVHTFVIGHSFGASIIYEATAGSIMRGLNRQINNPSNDAVCAQPHFPDLVLLINPAIEGARYETIHRMAEGIKCKKSPRLITITTATDLATSMAYPTAQGFKNAVATTASGMTAKGTEKQINSKIMTFGHMTEYHTHNLDWKNGCYKKTDCLILAQITPPESLPDPDDAYPIIMNIFTDTQTTRWQGLLYYLSFKNYKPTISEAGPVIDGHSGFWKNKQLLPLIEEMTYSYRSQ